MSSLFFNYGPLEEIFELAKTSNPAIADKLNETYFTVGPPVAQEGEFNTSVTLTGNGVEGIEGIVTIQYNRVDLAAQIGELLGESRTLTIPVPLTSLPFNSYISDVIEYFRRALGFNLTVGTVAVPRDCPDFKIANNGATGEASLSFPDTDTMYRCLPSTETINVVLVDMGYDLVYFGDAVTGFVTVDDNVVLDNGDEHPLDGSLNVETIFHGVDLTKLLGFGESSFIYTSGNWYIKDVAGVNAVLTESGLPNILGDGLIREATDSTFVNNTYVDMEVSETTIVRAEKLTHLVQVESGRTDLTNGTYFNLGYIKL